MVRATQLGREGVRNPESLVPVAGHADVEPGLGVHLEAAPGLLQDLQHVPLGYALLDPAGQDLGGGLGLPAASGRYDWLVGGDKPDPGHFQSVLDLGGDVGPARDPVDRARLCSARSCGTLSLAILRVF